MVKRNIPCIIVEWAIPDINLSYVASNNCYGRIIVAKFALRKSYKKIGGVTYNNREVYIFNKKVADLLDKKSRITGKIYTGSAY